MYYYNSKKIQLERNILNWCIPTVLHEFGHYIDNSLEKLSETREFKEIAELL